MLYDMYIRTAIDISPPFVLKLLGVSSCLLALFCFEDMENRVAGEGRSNLIDQSSGTDLDLLGNVYFVRWSIARSQALFFGLFIPFSSYGSLKMYSARFSSSSFIFGQHVPFATTVSCHENDRSRGNQVCSLGL